MRLTYIIVLYIWLFISRGVQIFTCDVNTVFPNSLKHSVVTRSESQLGPDLKNL
jgi:hypothetical protein